MGQKQKTGEICSHWFGTKEEKDEREREKERKRKGEKDEKKKKISLLF